MASEVAVDQITQYPSGVIGYRIATTVIENGEVVSKQYFRSTVHPGDDTSNLPPEVVAVCNEVWA